MLLAELEGGERAQRVAEQDVYTLLGPEQGSHRLVQVTRQVLQPEAVCGARALTVPA
jgi:hypothetical protein